MFYTRQKKWEPPPPGHFPGPPGGLAASLIPPAAKKQKKRQRNDAPIFFLDYPLGVQNGPIAKNELVTHYFIFLKN